MTLTLDPSELEQFRAIVAHRFGLHYEDGKLDFLAEVLRQRIDEVKSPSVVAYVDRLASSSKNSNEIRALAERLTVGETFFFRNPDNFRAFAARVLLDRTRDGQAERRLRILSAGCASGEEPYTLAITVHEMLPDPDAWDVEIRAIDVNAASLAKAARARYSKWSLRSTPEGARRNYFRPDGQDFILDNVIRRMVTFEERNLVDDDPGFWSPRYDAVFCRNVIMYFTPDVMRDVVRRVRRCLLPGGLLFLGHAETLRGLSQDFNLQHTHGTFYYQRREGRETPVGSPAPRLSMSDAITDPLATAVDKTGSWVDVIHQASERIASLAKGGPRAEAKAGDHASGRATPPSTMRSWSLALVLEAMRQERFEDALEMFAALPPDAHDAPDALLLRAALLTNSGRIAEAEDVCRRLLVVDELNAGAHYLMALCCEHAGNSAATVEHDQTAIYLDPHFAMPHLHLGLVARRTGDGRTARAELEQASILLEREDASRVLLFGGGFSRETLLQLCRAELRGAGSADTAGAA